MFKRDGAVAHAVAREVEEKNVLVPVHFSAEMLQAALQAGQGGQGTVVQTATAVAEIDSVIGVIKTSGKILLDIVDFAAEHFLGAKGTHGQGEQING